MLPAVELSESFDLITVFCVASKIWRSRMASNWRLASAIFSCSVTAVLLARRSGGSSAALTWRWSGEIFISTNNQFGLQGPGLFHGLENRHHIAWSHPEAVQGRGHFFDRRQLRQRHDRSLVFSHLCAGAWGDYRLTT